MPTTSQELAAFTDRVTVDDLPSEVTDTVGELLVDTAGCAVAAFASPPVKALRETYAGSNGDLTATVLGTAQSAAVADAALINAAMARYLDYNDCYMSDSAACHPSDHIMALVAVAEAEEATGKDLVEAVVAAYEVEGRGLDAAPVRPNGFDYVAWGVYSSVAAAGKLMGLSREELTNAFGIAGASNNPLYVSRRGEVSMWKGVAHAYATANAVEACRMARNGLTGPREVFEGEFGFFDSVATESVSFAEGPVFDDLRISETGLKPFPCGYYITSPVTGILRLIDDNDFDPKSIDSITVKTFEHAVDLLASADKWGPDLNRETADHSVPYTVAVAALDGEVTPAQYVEDRLRSDDVHRLMDRVEVESDPELTAHRERHPRHIPSVTTVRVGNQTYRERVNCPLGHPENPMSSVQVEEKMSDNCRGFLTDTQIERCVDACRSVVELDRVDPLIESMVV